MPVIPNRVLFAVRNPYGLQWTRSKTTMLTKLFVRSLIPLCGFQSVGIPHRQKPAVQNDAVTQPPW
jgi:hypothetical protein